MSGLDCIWLLENHNKNLDILEKQLSNIYTSLGLKELDMKNGNLKSKYHDLEKKIKKNKVKINKYESLLNQYNYTIKEIEKDLYNGDIKDLKQLEHLNEEKEKALDTINNLELDIIFMLEKEENAIRELKYIDKKLNETDFELKEMAEELEFRKKHLSTNIEKELDAIKKLEKNINTEALAKYNHIRKTKITAIVPIKDSICTGCNMRIPTYLLKPIKEKKELIYCENCGRILYHVNDPELSLI